MRFKILWIEDNAEADLFHLLAPVNVDGRFDVDIAVNATEGYTYLSRLVYDVIIVDTRIPPGDEPYWRACAERIQHQLENPILRLGLEMLSAIFLHASAISNNLPDIRPENKDMDKYSIFSIDPKAELIKEEKNGLAGMAYERKTAFMPRNILVQIICDSLQRQGHSIAL